MLLDIVVVEVFIVDYAVYDYTMHDCIVLYCIVFPHRDIQMYLYSIASSDTCILSVDLTNEV